MFSEFLFNMQIGCHFAQAPTVAMFMQLRLKKTSFIIKKLILRLNVVGLS